MDQSLVNQVLSLEHHHTVIHHTAITIIHRVAQVVSLDPVANRAQEDNVFSLRKF